MIDEQIEVWKKNRKSKVSSWTVLKGSRSARAAATTRLPGSVKSQLPLRQSRRELNLTAALLPNLSTSFSQCLTRATTRPGVAHATSGVLQCAPHITPTDRDARTTTARGLRAHRARLRHSRPHRIYAKLLLCRSHLGRPDRRARCRSL